MAKYAARSLVFEIGEALTPVAQVAAMGEPGSSRSLIDASCYGEDWTDWLVGQMDGESMDLQVLYDPEDTEHLALGAAYDSGDEETFGMSHAESGFHKTWPGLITKLTYGGGKEDKLAMNLSIKILNPGISDVEESS